MLLRSKFGTKAWFAPMRLTLSDVHSDDKKYNPIGTGGKASNNLKKN